MKGKAYRVGSLLIAFVLTIGAASDPSTDTKSALGSRSIKYFASTGNSALDTLLHFCRQEKIPLGVEYVDHALLRTPVKVKASNAPVAAVVNQILAPLKGYRWSIEDRVIVVTHASLDRADSQNLLRMTIPEFKTRESTLAEAGNILRMTIDRQLNPGVHGWAGNYPPGNISRKLGPLKLRNLSVRTILNRLVAEHGGAAWTVKVPPGYLHKLTSSGLWQMIEYQEPSRQHSAELEQILEEFSKREAKGRDPSH